MPVFMFPGQGSQKVGMGAGLFEKYQDLTKKADEILGYSIAELCLKDPKGEIVQTQFTQPAMYVVDCLTYLNKLEEMGGKKPNYALGHSLGEYCALFAAGSFDFETGLKMVKKRGEIMAKASGGGMAAVIGLAPTKIVEVLKENQLGDIDVANINNVTQTVISGKKEDIEKAKSVLEKAGCNPYVILKVGGAFHSKYMTPSRDEFKAFIDQFTIKAPEIPVIANYTALPYVAGEEKQNLVEQINHAVNWMGSIQYLLGKGEQEFLEIGPGNNLKGMVARIKRNE